MHNVRELKSVICLACANAFVRNRQDSNKNLLVVMSDFGSHIRKGFLNYKKYRLEIEEVLSEGPSYVFSKQEIIEKNENISRKENIYEVIDKKTNELKRRGLEEDEISIITSSHVQTMLENYQEYLKKQVLDIGQLSKIVDEKIIQMVQKFLDIAQQKFNIVYPVSLYYGLSLHIGSLVTSKKRTQKLGNQQIMEVIQEYHNEYMYSLQFISQIEKTYTVQLPIDEAVILTMFIIQKTTDMSSRKPVVLIAMHGNQSASSITQVINDLVKANNTYAFDMSLDSEPTTIYLELKKEIQRIEQGKGVIVIYDMGSFQNMLVSIAEETKIEIRPLYIPLTLVGIEASRRCSLDDDIENTYHQLIQSTRENLQYPEYKSSVYITLCHTGEGGAIEIKKYLEMHVRKKRNFIPLAISHKKTLVEKIKEIAEHHQIKSFVGTYDPNLFGIPFISIKEVFDYDTKKLDYLLDFNTTKLENVDMEAVYTYLDDSLEYVDITKLKKLLPTLIEEIENINVDELNQDQKLGLFVHISCAINRLIGNGKTPVNIQKQKVFKKYERMINGLIKCMKPIEKAFHIIINDDEIANIVCIVKKI
ncbi:MAG: PRD domain-containing protein [Coprobacillaceae bacterium]